MEGWVRTFDALFFSLEETRTVVLHVNRLLSQEKTRGKGGGGKEEEDGDGSCFLSFVRRVVGQETTVLY